MIATVEPKFTLMSFPAYCCPETGSDLQREGAVLRSKGGRTYPVIDDIPRFVEQTNYADAFGLQWNRYPRVQFDSVTGVPLTRERLERCMGKELFRNLEDRLALEAGCGAGRFTEILLQQGALVQSIDLSRAVEANQRNFPQDERHRIAQADIRHLPFQPQQFDVVLCLGVIQHTPNPEESIAALARQVKPGGALVIDHYRHNLSYYTKTAMPLRALLRRLPPERSIRWTENIVRTMLPLHKRARRSRLLQRALSRISPVQVYYQSIPQLSDDFQEKWAFLDTYDSLTDYYKHFRTRSQVRRAFEANELEVEYCEKGGNGVEARARRPQL